MPQLEPQAAALFTDGRNFVHLATLLPDGSPHSIPVWAIYENDRIAFFTQSQSRKARNVMRDPRVALSVVDERNPYRNVQIRGRVVETVEGDEALEVIDRISHHFTGAPFPMRSGTVYWIDPERVNYVELPFEHSPSQ
ncbi:MAG TPA: PPOX class F420-dependent oxidoreductase [Gaiellaceae bacterium]|nr:PPOX class F420-dependent oxidoreductase [Gaiellaceae bacterium]